MPKISIIMPVYNVERYLAQAIDSVLQQTLDDFELLIINDGSSDETDKIVNKYLTIDNRIVYIKNKQNHGLIDCLNLGLQRSKGMYIARLDGDDFWLDKNKLRRQLDFLVEYPDYGLIGTYAQAVSSMGETLFQLKFPITDQGIRKHILVKNCFVHSSVLFRKDIAISSGSYRPEEKFVEDYGLWLRIGRKYKYYNLPDVMVGYRIQFAGESIKNNIVQIKNSIKLISENKFFFPSYYMALAKWYLKYFLVMVFGIKLFSIIKFTLFKKT